MKKHYTILVGIFLLYAAPLSGGLIRGLPEGFFSFPPVMVNALERAEFSWPFFLMFCALFGMAISFFAAPDNFGFRIKRKNQTYNHFSEESDVTTERVKKRLPVWGKLGGLLTVVSWCLAWGQFDWLGVLRDYLFFPLWLGFIFTLDGIVYRRKNTSFFAHARKGFLLLFPLSSAMWWYFEYLNRFVQNWWYEGMQHFSGLHYIFYGSLCFSTVLPAIFEFCELMLSFSYVKSSFSHGPVRKKHSDIYAFGWMCIGILALFLAGLFPDVFFAVIWLAPLAIIVGTLGFCRTPSPFSSLLKGDYTLPVALAISALWCGLFWELWNAYSMPCWHYTIPYIARFRIFEMPLPGYAGYLPFGLICWAAWRMLVQLLPNTWRKQSEALGKHMEAMAFEEVAGVEEKRSA